MHADRVSPGGVQGKPRPIRVMLVDDHRSVLSGLERLIDGERPVMHVVAKATSRSAALALAADARPDVVVLDLDLGGEDGLEIIAELMARGGAHVLVLTGLRDPGIAEAAVVRGASGVVRKEEPAETLLKAIERVHRGELWLGRESMGRVLVHLRSNGAPRDADNDKFASLTPREREIVEQLANAPGADNRRLAARLSIGEHTLRNHLSRIYDKLGVPNRLELFLYAQRHGVSRRAEP
jgi:DNA-binding NarL/FixJ family response regulator